MHCKTRQILHTLFNTNQRNSLEKTFVARSYKSQPQKFETELWLDDLMQAAIWRYQLYSHGKFEPLVTWPCKLKALKSSL